MWPLAIYLRNQGRRVTWAIDNPVWHDNIDTFAVMLSTTVNRLRQATGSAQVDIVGHSMGGIVAAAYIKRVDNEGCVRRLITLGTPWSGSKIAVLGVGHQIQQLLPNSPTIDGLSEISTPTTAIWGPDDSIILPSSSAAPKSATCIEVQDVGHLSMLTSHTVMQLVHTALCDEPGES